MRSVYLPALAALISVACSSNTAPTASSSTAAPTMGTGTAHHPLPGRPAQTVAPAPTSDVPIVWEAPASFEKVDAPNPMRKATYKIARAAGDDADAELTVTVAGGDIDSNVQRWSGQFEGSPTPKREDREMSGFKLTVVELEGAFKGMAPPGGGQAPAAKPDTRMLAAIADVDGSLVFFKLTGPKKTVEAARSDFEKLLASLKRAG